MKEGGRQADRAGSGAGVAEDVVSSRRGCCSLRIPQHLHAPPRRSTPRWTLSTTMMTSQESLLNRGLPTPEPDDGHEQWSDAPESFGPSPQTHPAPPSESDIAEVIVHDDQDDQLDVEDAALTLKSADKATAASDGHIANPPATDISPPDTESQPMDSDPLPALHISRPPSPTSRPQTATAATNSLVQPPMPSPPPSATSNRHSVATTRTTSRVSAGVGPPPAPSSTANRRLGPRQSGATDVCSFFFPYSPLGAC